MRNGWKMAGILAAALIAPAPEAFAQLDCTIPQSGFCTTAIGGGKTAQNMRGRITMGTLNTADFFGCASAATCQLCNRLYTTKESACVNDLRAGTIPDYKPAPQSATVFNYLTDLFPVNNYPGDLGSGGETWVLLWDHLRDAATGDCAGYYAAQTDILNPPEFGNLNSLPNCTCISGTAGCSSLACFNSVTPLDSDACTPLLNTPGPGDEDNLGAMTPVPIPTLEMLSNTSDLAAPGNRATLRWVPACNRTIHDGAADPLLGYVVEGYVDANGNGLCDPPSVCDAASSNIWRPILEIAPSDSSPADAVPHAMGDASTGLIEVELVSLSLVSAAPIDSWECIAFRNRILFLDDRTFAAGPGGRDGLVTPVTSLPSGRGPMIASSVLPALISEFAGRFTGGNTVDLDWTVGVDSFTLYRVSKSDSATGPFQSVGEVRGEVGRFDYSLTDSTARSGGAGRGNAIWYRLEASGPGGSEEATVAVPVERGRK